MIDITIIIIILYQKKKAIPLVVCEIRISHDTEKLTKILAATSTVLTHWVTNTTRFICSRDGCNLVVPIGFFALDADLAASFNIKKLGRRVLRRRKMGGRRYKGFTPLQRACYQKKERSETKHVANSTVYSKEL